MEPVKKLSLEEFLTVGYKERVKTPGRKASIARGKVRGDGGKNKARQRKNKRRG